MRKQKSAFDRIQSHLTRRGAETPVLGSAREDLEMLVRRCDEVRSLGDEYGVELSPYMASLLRVSGMPAMQNQDTRAHAVASV